MPTLTTAMHRVCRAAQAGYHRRGERGDVPGWVLITLMTAGLVAALWTVADAQLQAMFQRAMDSVTGP